MGPGEEARRFAALTGVPPPTNVPAATPPPGSYPTPCPPKSLQNAPFRSEQHGRHSSAEGDGNPVSRSRFWRVRGPRERRRGRTGRSEGLGLPRKARIHAEKPLRRMILGDLTPRRSHRPCAGARRAFSGAPTGVDTRRRHDSWDPSAHAGSRGDDKPCGLGRQGVALARLNCTGAASGGICARQGERLIRPRIPAGVPPAHRPPCPA